MKDIIHNAKNAEMFLKSLASEHRLKLLCSLSTGEKSVTELMQETGIGQTSVSQHLAKLKAENIVTFRREHRTLYYRISSTPALSIMEILYNTFCKDTQNEK